MDNTPAAYKYTYKEGDTHGKTYPCSRKLENEHDTG